MNKSVDTYNDTYHHSIGKKSLNADSFALIEKIESSYKAPKLKVGDRARITKYTNIFSKSYTENWLKEISFIDSMVKANPWTYKIEDLNGEKMIGSFCEKEMLLSKL